MDDPFVRMWLSIAVVNVGSLLLALNVYLLGRPLWLSYLCIAVVSLGIIAFVLSVIQAWREG
jgi:hypothetical protein